MICCCCGFDEKHGVLFGQELAEGLMRFFMCERCFFNPHMFNPAKLDLSEYIFKIKQTVVPNYFARKRGVEDANYVLYAKRKAKFQMQMIESLYFGQKQLEGFI